VSGTPLYIRHASQKRWLCKITGYGCSWYKKFWWKLKKKAFIDKEIIAWLGGELRKMSFSLLSLRFLVARTYLTIYPLSYSHWKSFLLEFLTKSGKFGVPSSKDQHYCSYPNREEGMQVVNRNGHVMRCDAME